MRRYVTRLALGALSLAQLCPAGPPGSFWNLSGKGVLTLKSGLKEESILFGTENGANRVLAMVYESALLPKSMRKSIGTSDLTQILLSAPNGDQMVQFGAFSLIGGLTQDKTRTFRVPKAALGKLASGVALVLFSRPSTVNEKTDEGKLRGTLLAEGGSVRARLLEPPMELRQGSPSEDLLFESQSASVDIDLELATPFSDERARLKGSLLLKFTRPKSETAKKLAAQMASETGSGPLAVAPTPEGIATQRGVAGEAGGGK